MAGPPSKGVVEIIDLTLDDDDDDDGAIAIPQTHINGTTNGRVFPISADTRAATPDYVQGAPPPKRVKLTNTQYVTNTAQAIIYPYAQAGARQAVAEDTRLVEAVLREKVRRPDPSAFGQSYQQQIDRQLRAELLRQFESQIIQRTTQNGGVPDSVHGEIITVRRALLSRLVALPVGLRRNGGHELYE